MAYVGGLPVANPPYPNEHKNLHPQLLDQPTIINPQSQPQDFSSKAEFLINPQNSLFQPSPSQHLIKYPPQLTSQPMHQHPPPQDAFLVIPQGNPKTQPHPPTQALVPSPPQPNSPPPPAFLVMPVPRNQPSPYNAGAQPAQAMYQPYQNSDLQVPYPFNQAQRRHHHTPGLYTDDLTIKYRRRPIYNTQHHGLPSSSDFSDTSSDESDGYDSEPAPEKPSHVGGIIEAAADLVGAVGDAATGIVGLGKHRRPKPAKAPKSQKQHHAHGEDGEHRSHTQQKAHKGHKKHGLHRANNHHKVR